jgi:hypothetical protein
MSSLAVTEFPMIEIINGIEYDLGDLSGITVIDVGEADEPELDEDEVINIYISIPPGSLN